MVKEIKKNLYYIGVNDNDIDLFEGQYRVPNGISYNSYILIDKKIVIFDTCDITKKGEWLKNVDEVLKKYADSREPDYLVVSHLEEDHAGNIENLLNKYKNINVILNPISEKMFSQFFDIDIENRKTIVKEGEEINVGENTLKFFMAQMVHWPEVMFTYVKGINVLFSADGFGKFGIPEKLIISSKDENINNSWDNEARRYYINICGKYGMQVQNVLNKLINSELELSTICPLHGPILSEDISHFLNLYTKWSTYEPEEKGALIVYGTIHGNTKDIANKMYNDLKQKGKNVRIMDIARCDMSEAISEAYKYSSLIIVCVTYNMSIFPNMNLYLNLLKEKNFQKRNIAIVENGSWAPNVNNVVKDIFKNSKDINFIDPVVTIKSKLNGNTKKSLEQLEEKIIEKI